MKHVLLALAILCVFQSCKKESTEDTGPGANEVYLNAQSGSTWQYHEVNASDGTPVSSDYTITATGRDSTINGKPYHVYNYSFGGSQYLNKTNNDYYEHSNFADLGEAIERLYLKAGARVNSKWTQEVSVPVPDMPLSVKVKLTNEIADISDRTVNGKTYKNVIHVKSTISSPDVPVDKLTSDIHSYYAPEVGLIENSTKIKLNYFVLDLNIDIKTSLTSADLK